MTSPKLLLTIVTGGILLGALLGQMAHPRMKFADAADRNDHSDSQYSATPMQFVESGPEDLTPSGWVGPAYAQPAVFAPQYEPVPDYAPPVAEGEGEVYSALSEADPDVAPDVDQASRDAAAAAAMIVPSPGSSSSLKAPHSQANADIAPIDPAPADKTS